MLRCLFSVLSSCLKHLSHRVAGPLFKFSPTDVPTLLHAWLPFAPWLINSKPAPQRQLPNENCIWLNVVLMLIIHPRNECGNQTFPRAQCKDTKTLFWDIFWIWISLFPQKRKHNLTNRHVDVPLQWPVTRVEFANCKLLQIAFFLHFFSAVLISVQ